MMTTNKSFETSVDEPQFAPITYDIGKGATAFSLQRGIAADKAADQYSGFNICHYTGDDNTHIATCRQRLADFLGIATDRLIIPRQRHTINVAIVNNSDQSQLDNIDALVTNCADLALCINTADCLPIMFYEPVAQVIAIAHAGWRGLYDDIITPTVDAMKSLGASTQHIKAAIGVHICSDCYEVDHDFAERFISRFPNTPSLLHTSTSKPHLNLSEAAIYRLTSTGIPFSNIVCTNVCSKCNSGLYYSARKLGVESGRIPSIIMLHQ